VLVTSRVHHAVELIRSISAERMLVESDSHDVRMMSRWVWGAVEWMATIKGWRVEGRDGHHEDWVLGLGDEPEKVGKDGRPVQGEIWAVQTLERNWARFAHLTD
jgi:hypothetical protein